MKDCTGPRYDDEGQTLALIDDWHGKYGHINLLQRDHDSVITNYGKHDRVVTTVAQDNTLYCRVDNVWQWGEPTPEEIVKVCRKYDGLTGRWQLVRKETWNDGKSTDYYFERGI